MFNSPVKSICQWSFVKVVRSLSIVLFNCRGREKAVSSILPSYLPPRSCCVCRMSDSKVFLRLIFVNQDTKSPEISVTVRPAPALMFLLFIFSPQTDSTIREVKAMILKEVWPPSMPDPATIAHLRLFSGGRELPDDRTISGKFPVGPPSVHRN